MAYDIILFDLDGTLTDPGIGITNAVIYALKQYDIQVENREELYRFIGPPLLESFQSFFGFTEEDAEQAVIYYRDYYREKGIFENYVYPGMDMLLGRLRRAGKALLVATSKPEEFALQILENFKLAEHFTVIAGASMDGSRIRKADVIDYALKQYGMDEREQVLMVGDRKHDILGAKEIGIASAGVLYGYGSREELEAAGADYIVSCVDNLYPLIVKE